MSNLNKWLDLYPGPAAVVADDGRILAASKEFCREYIGDEGADPTVYDISGLPYLASEEGEKILDFLERGDSEKESLLVKSFRDGKLVTYSLTARRVRLGGRRAHIVYLNTTSSIKAALAKIQEDIRAYYRIAESSSVAGILFLENGRVTFSNPYVESYIGYTSEELMGMSPLIIFPPEEREKVDGLLKYAEEEGKGTSQILRYLKKGGELGWGTFSFSLWREEGKLVGAIIFFDISEKMELRDRLEDFRQKLQATISTMPDIFVEVTPEGKVADISAPSDDPLLYLKEKSSGKATSILPPDIFDFLKKAVAEVLAGGEGTFIYSFKYRGIWRFYEAKGAPAGKNAVFIFRNITDKVIMRTILQSVNRVNMLLLKAGDEKELCQKTVEALSGGDILKALWIALLEKGSWELMAAHPSDVLNELFSQGWDRDPELFCPHIKRVLETRRGVVVEHSKEEGCPHFQRLWGYDRGCELLLPMLYSGEVVGLLNLFMEGVEKLGEEEVGILQAMANDLAFSIRDIEDQRRLRVAYRQLKENLKRFENIADRIRNPLMVAEGLNYLLETGKIGPGEYHQQIKEQLRRIEGFLDRLREEEEERSYLLKEDLEGE